MGTPPALSWIASLKLAQLKQLAEATGINSGGTKSLLGSRLRESLPQSKLSSPGIASSQQRILSIDMGIRNLAYCQIALPLNWPLSSDLPVLEAWKRVAISTRQGSGANARSTKVTTPDPVVSDEGAGPVREAFEPATYAQHAHALITQLVLENGVGVPADVLIERQRFRSMGGSAVQEWTLRVNMFEAMLYAVLKTLQAEGRWTGRVWPVTPAKVAKYWEPVEEEEKEEETEPNDTAMGSRHRSAGQKVARGKEAKVNLVRSWLESGNVVELDGEARAVARAYLEKKKARVRQRMDRPEAIGKLDDLADCLLQGMTWVQWEKRRRRILNDGLAGLGDERQEAPHREQHDLQHIG